LFLTGLYDPASAFRKQKKIRKVGETSATIRIPLNFKDREAISAQEDPRKDRSALSSIESELAKRREDDVGWEDLTDVSVCSLSIVSYSRS
jgi:hypothetical protein